MAKMYYTEAEAAEKLGVSPDQLLNLAREGKLQVYADGPNKMYKASEVDELAGVDQKAESDIVLTPADTEADAISLADEEDEGGAEDEGGKGDTVITSEGISIFDDEDLEIDTADPMAKTQIAPSIEDQITLEGVGSGSGLLDLTRESDDTSLGAVLDHIDVDEVSEQPPAPEVAGGFEAAEPAEAPVAPAGAAAAEAPDPTAGAFSGMLIVGTILTIITLGAAMGVIFDTRPSWVAALASNALILLLAGIVVAGIAAVVGWVLGKTPSGR